MQRCFSWCRNAHALSSLRDPAALSIAALGQRTMASCSPANEKKPAFTRISIPRLFKPLASLVAVSICSIAYLHSFHYLWNSTNANQSPETRRVQAIIDGMRHARIASLDLSNMQITTLDGIEFPGSLISLDLRNNQISSFKSVKFPARLESLYLSQNQISSLKGVKLPAELRWFT
jgi:Leucine-rich repeat (LRR) protein